MKIKSAVCILCERDGKYLSVSRRKKPSLWGMPGGKVDENESNVEAIQREVGEETGITDTVTKFEPLFCGICEGDVNYWVTTYFWVDPFRVQDSELRPEEGILIDWKTETELCDPAISPFALYNRRVFAALNERNQK